MKSLILSLALMVCSGTAFAQTTITGKVVDKKGEPMPGAKVQVKGTGTSVLTNMDGTFSIETTKSKPKLVATYVGWNNGKKKAGLGDNIIKMGKSNWWNEKPDHYQWFVGANMAFPGIDEEVFKGMAPGIMFGMVKNYGWYVKGQFNGTVPDGDHNCEAWTTGKIKSGFMSVSGGGIVRLGCPIHLYAGIGYLSSRVRFEKTCGEYTKPKPRYDEDNDINAMQIEMGLMLRVKHIFLHTGLQLPVAHGHEDGMFVGNFGLGYIF